MLVAVSYRGVRFEFEQSIPRICSEKANLFCTTWRMLFFKANVQKSECGQSRAKTTLAKRGGVYVTHTENVRASEREKWPPIVCSVQSSSSKGRNLQCIVQCSAERSHNYNSLQK